jgi:histidyl-tRNA synthetase
MTLQKSAAVAARATDIYIAPLGAGMNIPAAQLAGELRRQGLIVTVGDESFKLKKSLETASKTAARFALIVGENEVASGKFALKDLSKGEQVSVGRGEIARLVKST